MKNDKYRKYFVFSLLVNAFFIGVFASLMLQEGSTFAKRPHHLAKDFKPPFHPGAPHMQTAALDISETSKDIIEETWHKNRKNVSDDMEKMEDIMFEGRKHFLADDLDIDALEKTHNEIKERDDKIKETFFNAIKEIAVKLPKEDRQKYFRQVLQPRAMLGGPPPHRR